MSSHLVDVSGHWWLLLGVQRKAVINGRVLAYKGTGQPFHVPTQYLALSMYYNQVYVRSVYFHLQKPMNLALPASLS